MPNKIQYVQYKCCDWYRGLMWESTIQTLQGWMYCTTTAFIWNHLRNLNNCEMRNIRLAAGKWRSASTWSTAGHWSYENTLVAIWGCGWCCGLFTHIHADDLWAVLGQPVEQLIESSWLRPEWPFPALYNLDGFREPRGCSMFTDPGVRFYVPHNNSFSWACSSAVHNCPVKSLKWRSETTRFVLMGNLMRGCEELLL